MVLVGFAKPLQNHTKPPHYGENHEYGSTHGIQIEVSPPAEAGGIKGVVSDGLKSLRSRTKVFRLSLFQNLEQWQDFV